MSIFWIRNNSGLSMTSDLSLFLLPLGRPRLRFGSADLTFFASFLALQAAFSSSLRTVCSTHTGYERRWLTLTNETTKKDRLGITFCCNPEKK